MELVSSGASAYFLPHVDLQRLLDALLAEGFQVIGPTVRQDALVYDEITSTQDLPQGYRDKQEPGLYRLERTSGTNYFAWEEPAPARHRDRPTAPVPLDRVGGDPTRHHHHRHAWPGVG